MKPQLLLAFAALLVLVLVGLWWSSSESAAEATVPVQELSPGTALEPLPAGDRPEVLPELVHAAEPEPERAAVEPSEAPVEPAATPRTPPPSTAHWVSGRVVFPDVLPHDAGELVVTARGRRFSTGKGETRREHAVEVARDGSFRVAFAESTRKGWIDLEGRYLYLPERLRIDLDEVPDPLVLAPALGGVVRGRVRPPAGRIWDEESLEGAHARIDDWSSGNRITRRGPIDEAGGFELTSLPPGHSYHLSLELPTWSDDRRSGVEVLAGEVAELDFDVVAGTTLRGRVVDREGQPVPDVPIELSGDPTDGGWLHETTRSAEDGSFAFAGIRDAALSVKAALDEHLPVEQDLGHVPEGSLRHGIELVVVRGHAIEGVVRWPDGKPVAGAWVTVSQDREVDGLRFGPDDGVAEKTAEDGSFTVTGLEPRACVVRASAKSFREKDLAKAAERAAEGRDYKLRARGPTYKVRLDDVQPGTRGLELVLTPGEGLSGRVVDDRGEGLTGFAVSAEPVGGSGSELGRADAVKRVVVSLDGSFEIDGLREGVWRVRAQSKGHQASEPVEVQIPGSGELELVTPRYAELQGRVLDPGGEPISGARVWVDELEPDEVLEVEVLGRQWGENATTNQRGEFTVRDLGPGRSRLWAGAKGYGASLAQLVEVEAGDERDGLVLRLRPAARIRGVVHASVGEVEGRTIQVRAERGGNYWKRVTTDSGGRFELEDLDPGAYRLTLQAGGSKSDDWRSERSVAAVVEVTAGEQASVVLGAPPADPTYVSGRVTSGGRPLAGVFVGCRAKEGGEFDNDAGLTGPDGEYRLAVAGAGTYGFRVGRAGGGPDRFERELVAGENPGTDFELADGRVTGVVLGASGRPAAGCDLNLVRVDAPRTPREMRADEEGRFSFEFVEPGEYFLRANGNRGRFGLSNRARAGAQLREGLVVAEGGVLEGIEVELEAEALLEGTVIGVDGLPVSGATLIVETPAGNAIHAWGGGRSSNDGGFRVRGLPSGRLLVRARKNEAESPAREVRLEAGSTSELELTLEAR